MCCYYDPSLSRIADIEPVKIATIQLKTQLVLVRTIGNLYYKQILKQINLLFYARAAVQ